ncbi:GmrSD restriction endonuclease domain-containing protein [Helicobacter pylori]|uniref:GmrSD restriction endonuclease domain-containing protein n=1 Tax=Helicobacter pylori TaxID=210 RepID=UPI00387F2F77
MKAGEATLLEFFEQNQTNQFVIPIYQRLYSWGKEQCKQLWDDIIKIGGNDKMNGHFIGSILYARVDDTHSSPLLIIDGQQRLTTITLLFIALRNRSSDEVKRKKMESYLINSDKDGDKKFRLILSESDRDTLLSLIDKNKRKPSEPSLKIVENFKLFEKWISENTDKLETIFKGLKKLMIVWIALKKEKDNPQLIFESMNSKGIELTQTDLIRNYIVMETEIEKQEDFYNQYWRAVEEDFKQNETLFKQNKKSSKQNKDLFNRFVRHYLTIKTREIPNISRVYGAFKDYQQKEGIEIEDLLKDLQKYCGYFCQIAFKKEADKDLNKALNLLVDLEMDVIYPLLLELYSDYKDGVLSKQDFIPIIALTESYICRRAVCGFGLNGLNKFFPSFTKKIDKKQYLKSVEEHFGSLTGNQKFPNDFEFKDSFITKELYGRNKTKKKKTRYFLERLENFNTKEPVNTQECTTEHIMPQTLMEEWKRDLGENFQAIHEKYLHTIGNLTLTGYNEKYSNNSFQEKRDMEKGFKQSSLKLNQSLKDLEVFGEKEIKKRANDLADWALEIWAYPKLDAETLEEYKPKKEKKVYDLSSYKFGSHSRELFDILSKEIKALDKRITEKFMKHYITYKHDTIFASIAPLKSELNLNLKMDFSELQDEIKEKLKIRDVSNIGHLGIVSKKVKVVEVKLETKESIPYCLGLIKQALEKQMNGKNRQ